MIILAPQVHQHPEGALVRTIAILEDQKINSVAFPLIGAGTGGIRKELVIKFMSEEISKSDFKGKVILVLYKKKA